MQVHINAKTHNRYFGKNISELSRAMQSFGYSKPEWATFKQFQMIGKKIKAGEHSHARVFQGFGKMIVENEEGKRVERSYPLGFAPVFNIDQTA